MKKSQLKKIIKESLLEGGYSNRYPGGKTPGLTTDVLNKILLRIAQGKGTEEEKYEGDPERGNKILDTADQENVDRILRGEEPQYNEVSRMQELAGIKEIYIDDKGNLKNFETPNDEEVEAASHLQKLGFNVQPIDNEENLYYLYSKRRNRYSPSSKNKSKIELLKTQYPDNWGDAELKFDNNWLK